jgi:hypothetical protein
VTDVVLGARDDDMAGLGVAFIGAGEVDRPLSGEAICKSFFLQLPLLMRWTATLPVRE